MITQSSQIRISFFTFACFSLNSNIHQKCNLQASWALFVLANKVAQLVDIERHVRVNIYAVVIDKDNAVQSVIG